MSSDSRRLDSLPPPSQAALLAVVAAFLPYYAQPQARLGNPGHEIPVTHIVVQRAAACGPPGHDINFALLHAAIFAMQYAKLEVRDP